MMPIEQFVGKKFAILLLNKGLNSKSNNAKKLFAKIWSEASLRIGVDGGNNALQEMNVAVPDIISGDFDSIRPTILEGHKQQQNTRVIPTPDQDDTDFTKAVQIALAERENSSRHSFECIVAITSLGGRIDHLMSNINTLYKFVDTVPIFMYDIEVSLSWMLSNTCEHAINVEGMQNSRWCSLVPVGEPCTVTTTGLKWDLNEDVMQYGGLISTSNELETKSTTKVTIKTSKPLFWSINIP